MSCPVCLEAFRDPVVLPCGHTFCRGSCAQPLIRNECLKCPTCRTTHWVPEGEEGLPRNYALQDILDKADQTSPQSAIPYCQDHPDDAVSLFCTQCYKLVCLRCCLGQMMGDTPRHFQHEVIAIDQTTDYVQNVLTAASEYVKSRKDEEMTIFETLAEANEQLQERLQEGCCSIQTEERRLKRLVEDRSTLLIGQLQSLCSASNLPNQSQTSLSKVIEYNALLNYCEELAAGNHHGLESTNWKKCEDLGRLLQCIDSMPASSTGPSPRQTLTAQMIRLNTDHAQAAIESTLTFNIESPSSPVFRLEDCVFSENSASLSWSFRPEEKINYFTFYFETAIYVHGMCKDLQSFDVTDFGRCTAQTTIRSLESGKRYRAYVLSRNDVGESARSDYLYFKAISCDSEAKII